MEQDKKDPRVVRLGGLVKKLRKERGLTLDQLAAETQLSKSFLSYLESGEKSVGIDALSRLVEALSIQADAVLQKAGYLSPAAGKQANLRTLLRERLGLPQADLDHAMNYLDYLASKNKRVRSKERRR